MWALKDIFEGGEFRLVVLLQLFREADEVLSASSCYSKLSAYAVFLGQCEMQQPLNSSFKMLSYRDSLPKSSCHLNSVALLDSKL